VTPGTKFVTIGGAIANDIHGKNHHVCGSFGNQVIRFELLRSDGTRLLCSETENADWYRATIGGLGLTGYVSWADIKLRSIRGPYIDVESIKFGDLQEFASISKEKTVTSEYTVAWVDCIAKGKHLGRGLFISGDHSKQVEPDPQKMVHRSATWKNVPFDFPRFALNSYSVRIFNEIYYQKQLKKRSVGVQHYDPFFYPLDGILNWNRIYGKRGFLQWQCVVPHDGGYDCIRDILAIVSGSKMASFLVVLKEFGDVPASGMLSFPMPGVTLALDFTNIGSRLFGLLSQLDELVSHAGGRIYPAKDARMSAETFRHSYTNLAEFEKFIDPKFSSSFYRRVSGSTRSGNTV
jgi:FAD/FMN-containing dehydrogenase